MDDSALAGGNDGASWPRGTAIRGRLIARCEAWCSETRTGRTILALALTRNAGFLTGLDEGVELTLEMYDRVMARLDVIERLDAIAGPLAEPRRSGARTPEGARRKKVMLRRCLAFCRVTQVQFSLLVLALTHDSTLMRVKGAISADQWDTYCARLDALEAHVKQYPDEPLGESDGKATDQDGQPESISEDAGAE